MKLFLVALLPAVALCQLGGGISETTQVPDAALDFAMTSINDKFAATNGGHSQNLKLVNVAKSSSQVVNGMNYFLTLHVTGDMVCDVTVWYRAYMTTPEALQLTAGPTCRPLNMPAAPMGMMVGGQSAPKALDTTDATVMDALSFAACAYNDRSNAMFASFLGETSSVTFTSQVTSGMTYRFHQVPIMETECQNSGCNMTMLTACPTKTNGMKSTCSFTVQSQPWMTPAMTLTNMMC